MPPDCRRPLPPVAAVAARQPRRAPPVREHHDVDARLRRMRSEDVPAVEELANARSTTSRAGATSRSPAARPGGRLRAAAPPARHRPRRLLGRRGRGRRARRRRARARARGRSGASRCSSCAPAAQSSGLGRALLARALAYGDGARGRDHPRLARPAGAARLRARRLRAASRRVLARRRAARRRARAGGAAVRPRRPRAGRARRPRRARRAARRRPRRARRGRLRAARVPGARLRGPPRRRASSCSRRPTTRPPPRCCAPCWRASPAGGERGGRVASPAPSSGRSTSPSRRGLELRSGGARLPARRGRHVPAVPSRRGVPVGSRLADVASEEEELTHGQAAALVARQGRRRHRRRPGDRQGARARAGERGLPRRDRRRRRRGGRRPRRRSSAATRSGSPLDVTDRPGFTAFLDEVERRLGPIDVLVNNAGIMPVGPLDEEDDATAVRMLEINLHAVIHGTKEAIRRMKPRGTGHIVNVASSAGQVRLPQPRDLQRDQARRRRAVRGRARGAARDRRRGLGRDAELRQDRALDRHGRDRAAFKNSSRRGRRRRRRRRAEVPALRRLRAEVDRPDAGRSSTSCRGARARRSAAR